MEKRRLRKRILAAVMSVIMTLTLLFANGSVVKANTTDQKTIVFNKRESNNVTGRIYYKLDDSWEEITSWDENGSYTLTLDDAVMSVVIRAVPSEGGYISQSNSKIGISNITSQNAEDLKSDTGLSVNLGNGTSINVDIEFDNNSGQPQNPNDQRRYEANTFNFNVTNYLGDGGDVYVKLYNGEEDITSKFETPDKLVLSENGKEGYLHVIAKSENTGEGTHFTDMNSVPLVVTENETEVKATKIQILICPKTDGQPTFSLSDEVRISMNNNGDGDSGNVRINKKTQEGADNTKYNDLFNSGYLYELPTVDAAANASYEMKFEFVNQNQGSTTPIPPTQGVSEDFTVKIGNDTVYKYNVVGDEKKINVPADSKYEVEETQDGIAIKPKKGTDKEHNPETDIANKTSLTLEPITATGSGKVEVYAGLNYTPEGTQDGTQNGSHIEEDVPITINASESGYSFEANGDVDFHICWGNFRSTATLLGGVKARGFTVNDLKSLTIGTSDAPVQDAFCAPLQGDNIYESSYVEFNLAEINIYANKAFTNYNQIRAWDEAKVNVNATTMFDNVNSMQVQTGGKFNLTSTSNITVPSEVKVGYYTEIGQILTIEKDGRFQDKVNMVTCTEGDHSETSGRYKYTISDEGKKVVLESTTKKLYSLGYSFLPESGDQYVEHGHFKISAGSGLKREGMTDGGEYWFEAGTEVTFKLVPDTGYKYTKGTFKFNGDGSEKVVKPTEETGVYIFTMPSNPIHVSCEFEKADDEINVTSSNAVKVADIGVADGTINGVAKFDVKDKKLDASEEEQFKNAAGDMVLDTVLDLSMNEVVDKIGTDESWVTPVTNLEKPMEVKLGLDSALGGYEEYVVVRQHDGQIDKLETEYDSNTNSVTFETDKFSTYAIAYKGTRNVPVNPPASNPDPTPALTPSPEPTPAPTPAPTEESKLSMAPVSEDVTTSVSKEVESVVEEIVKGTDTTVVDEDTATKIKEAAEQGKEINTEVVAETVEKEKVDTQEVKAIEEKVKSLQSVVENVTNTIKKITSVAQFINVEILIKADGEKLGNLKELKEPIKLVIAIPDDLKKNSRKFFVVRLHDGKVEKLESIMNDDGTLTFTTDKFSTYALAYEDTVTVEKTVGKTKIGSTTRTSTSVTIPWSKVAGATKYRVYYKVKGAKSYTRATDTTSLKYTVKGLKPATTYIFAVKAYGNGKWSDVYATKVTTTSPSKVKTPTVIAGSRKVTIKYSKVTGATGYEIYMAKGNGKYVKIKTTAANYYCKTKLTKGATYKFKVRAFKKVGSNVYYGAYSSAKVVKVK